MSKNKEANTDFEQYTVNMKGPSQNDLPEKHAVPFSFTAVLLKFKDYFDPDYNVTITILESSHQEKTLKRTTYYLKTCSRARYLQWRQL